MRHVVLDVMHLRLHRLAGERLGDRVVQRLRLGALSQSLEDQLQVRSLLQDEKQATPVVHLRVQIDGDVLEVAKLDPRLLQAKLHRQRRQSGSVLDAAEAFLFDGGNELAIAEDGGGGVTVVGIDAENDHGRRDYSSPV